MFSFGGGEGEVVCRSMFTYIHTLAAVGRAALLAHPHLSPLLSPLREISTLIDHTAEERACLEHIW